MPVEMERNLEKDFKNTVEKLKLSKAKKKKIYKEAVKLAGLFFDKIFK